MKRFLFMMTVLMVSMTAAFAEVLTGKCGTNVTYTLDTSTGVMKIEGTGAMSDYSYSSLNGTYVTTAPWRSYYQIITSVVVSQGVTSIGSYAFYACSSLTSITIPNSVTSIGNYAFSWCFSITSIIIPESVTSIGDYAFSWCSSLTSITIPESVTSIGGAAFYGCSSLTSITIPESVTSIGSSAFRGCSGLTSISVDPNNTTYDSRNNCNALIKTTNNELVFGCKNTTIPEGVTSIGGFAFYGCSSLTSITIPSGVTSIGNYAFYDCSSLTSITIPNSVTSIGGSAFYGCSSLASISIPSSVTSIGSDAFKGCSSLTSITIPSSVTSIGSSAFYGCSSLTSITIPEGVTSIGNYAFYNCSSLTSINIPEGVTSIGNYAFYGTNISKIFCLGATPATVGGSDALKGTVYVPLGSKSAYQSTSYWSSRTIYEGITEDDNFILRLMDNSYLMVEAYTGIAGESETQAIPSSAEIGGNTYNVTKINDNAFTNSNALTNVVMPSSIESVGSSAFKGCKNLKSVTLSKNITTLSSYAFQDCSSLERIDILAGTMTLGSYVFDGCKALQAVTMKDNVTSMGAYCFRNCENLMSITLSKSITSIPSNAFQNCKALSEVSLESIRSIESYAYDGCASIQNVSIPAGCTSIATTAFNRCTALKAFTVADGNGSYSTLDGVLTNKARTQIVAYPSAKGSTYEIPSSISTIGEYAFRGAELTSISIPSTLSTIYNYAFADCPNLKSAIFESSTSNITLRNYIFNNTPIESVEIYRNISNYSSTASYNSFYNRTSLKSAVVGGNASSLYASMFYGCTSLSHVTLGENVTSIGSNAFYGCTSLNNVSVGEKVTTINSGTFSGCTGLTSLTLNDAITTIGSNAFYGCSGLASIKLPATVSSIGDAFLSGCTGLREINAKMATPQALQASAFTGVDKNACKLIVPGQYLDTYNETPGWLSFNDIMAEDDETLRKLNVTLTDGGMLFVDSRNYNCEGSHSFYISAIEDVKAIITPSAHNYLKSVKLDGVVMNSQMNADTLLLTKGHSEATLEVVFAPSTETTDIATLSEAIYTDTIQGLIGTQMVIPVKLKNVDEVSGFQFDLVLPDGISVATDEDGFLQIALSTQRTTVAKTNYFESSEMPDGSIRVLCSSTKGYAISGNDGEVALVTVNIAEDMEEGFYPIQIKNIVLSDVTGDNKRKVSTVISSITLSSYLLGDVNGDTEIDVADISAIASYILGHPSGSFVEKAADLNGDTEIDVADISALAYFILHPETAQRAKARKVATKKENIENAYNTLYAEMLQAEAGTDVVLPIMMRNSIEATGFQLDLILPEGVTLKDATISNERTSSNRTSLFDYAHQADGTHRILCNSTKGLSFNGHDGEVMTLTLHIDKDAELGAQTIALKDMVLTDATGMLREESSLSESTLWVGNATDIHEIASEKDAPAYDIQGRQVSKKQKGIHIQNGKKTVVK